MRARDYNKSALITAPALAVLCVCVRQRERGKDWNGKMYQSKQGSVQVVDVARDYGTAQRHSQQKLYHNTNTKFNYIQDIDEFVSSSEQIWRNVALYHLFTNGSSAVNGCRQNESQNS